MLYIFYYRCGQPGQPFKAIDYDKIKHLRKLGLSWVKIAEKLNMSRQTLYRHIGDSNLAGYTNNIISNQELDSVISVYLANHPNDGEHMVIRHLQSSEIFVQRSRVCDSIHTVDPSGVAERRRTTIKRSLPCSLSK